MAIAAKCAEFALKNGSSERQHGGNTRLLWLLGELALALLEVGHILAGDAGGSLVLYSNTTVAL